MKSVKPVDNLWDEGINYKNSNSINELDSGMKSFKSDDIMWDMGPNVRKIDDEIQDIFNVMRKKFGDEEAIYRIQEAINTGNYNLITRDFDARSGLQNVSLTEADFNEVITKNFKISKVLVNILLMEKLNILLIIIMLEII